MYSANQNNMYRHMRPSYSPQQQSYSPNTGSINLPYNVVRQSMNQPNRPLNGMNAYNRYDGAQDSSFSVAHQPIQKVVNAKTTSIHPTEEVTIDMILSPLLLKAHSILKDCEVDTNILDAFQKRLRQKLDILKANHRNFNADMQEQIRKAQLKYQNAQSILAEKQLNSNKNNRSKSADILTKKQVKFSEESVEGVQKIETPKPVNNRRSRQSTKAKK